MKRARTTYRDENKNNSFNHEDAWALLRSHSKWAAPGRVDLTEGEHVPVVNIEELFGPDARPRRPGKQRLRKKTKSDTSASTGGSSSSAQFEEFMTRKLHLKREATATLVYCDNQVTERVDVCMEGETVNYLNRRDVRRAMHARLVGVWKWEVCSNILDYELLNIKILTINIVGSLIKEGVRVLVY
nr:serine carboxypeptidase-like 45 [Tanacetum cinerariifolium]